MIPSNTATADSMMIIRLVIELPKLAGGPAAPLGAYRPYPRRVRDALVPA
jgi:hypothetical protein